MLTRTGDEAAIMIFSFLVCVGSHLLIVRKERTWINWATPTFVFALGTRYIFQFLYLMRVGDGGSIYAYCFCYGTYALSALAGAVAFCWLRPIEIWPVQVAIPNVGRLPWILLLLGWMIYLPILVEFREYLNDPRQIYIMTRTGYGIWYFGSTTIATLGFVVFLFKRDRTRLGTLVYFFLCSALAYWHGSKGQILTYVLVWMLYPVYVNRHAVSLSKGLGFLVSLVVLCVGSFALFAGAEDVGEVIVSLTAYADYVRNAMLVIDDPEASRYYGRLMLENEIYSRVPRQLMPDKPKDFGPFLLAKRYTPAIFRRDEGVAAFDIGVQYADFGPWSAVLICFSSGCTAWVISCVVRRLRRSPAPQDFVLLLFLSGVSIIPVAGAWYLPETLVLAATVKLFLRFTPIRGSLRPSRLGHSSARVSEQMVDMRQHLYNSDSPMMTLRLSPRTRRVFEAGVSAVFGKGIVLLVNAVSIPIVVRFLGPELFGVWITISSALSILMVLDLGVANALTNLISEAYARDSRSLAAKYAANSFWVMVCLAAVLGALGALIYRRVPWAVFLHLQNGMEARRASQTIGAAYIVFLLGLPAGLAAKMLGAYQELRIANLFAVAASVAGLLGVVVVVRWHGSLPILILASFGSTVLTNYICLLWIWSVHKPWLRPSFRHWELGIARRLMSGGSEFFVLQLAGLIVFNSDNLVIAHYLGPAEVTPYSVTWKLVGYSAALQIIITPALWPAYAEAYVRGDIEWIRRMLRLVMASTMSVAGCACAVLVWFGRQIIGLWAGPVAVPPEGLLVAMCLWIMISTYMANTSTVLLATNETRMQAWLSVGAAALNLGLSILLVQRIGPIGVILATIISYMVVLIGPQTWKVYSVLHPVVSDDTAEVRS